MDEFDIHVDPTITTADNEFVAPEDWDSFHSITERDGSGVSVAVMDSGIDTSHSIFDHYGVTVEQPDIDGLPTDGSDSVGHGTAVAGTILLMAPNVDVIYDVPIFGGSGRTGFDTIETAYRWLIDHADGIDMVNMSWGSSSAVREIDTLHNELEQAGVDAVVAAGNTDRQTGSPATASRAFAVAACTTKETMTRWSSPTDNLSALGRNVAMPAASGTEMGKSIPASEYSDRMRDIGGDWIKASGTSFSCPGILGMAATFRSSHVSPMGVDVDVPFEEHFVESARDIRGTGEDGAGYVDYEAAVEESTEPETVDATVWSLSWGPKDYVFIDYDAFESGKYDVDVDLLEAAFTRKR